MFLPYSAIAKQIPLLGSRRIVLRVNRFGSYKGAPPATPFQALNDKLPLLFRNADCGLHPRIKLQKVALHPIAENDAVLRH